MRLTPRPATIRALFARSGNRCAFPGCSQPLVNEEHTIVGEICHIEAPEPEGPRFNPLLSDEDLRAYPNLILLCRRHHKEIDSEMARFTVEVLQQMKARHEANFVERPFAVDRSLVEKALLDFERAWMRLDAAQAASTVPSDVAVRITRERFGQTAERARRWLQVLQNLGETIQRGESHWEHANLGLPNCVFGIDAAIDQMEISYLEQLLRTEPTDETSRKRLDALTTALATKIKDGAYYD